MMMQSLLNSSTAAIGVLRLALFGVAAALAVVCTLDWMVRTRKIAPFGAIARFMRNSVDPLLKPVERRVVRAGGLPASAPWWALGAVVLGGIILISLLEFFVSQLAFTYSAITGGPGGIVRLLITWAFSLVQLALIV